jgi:hypothetical protein
LQRGKFFCAFLQRTRVAVRKNGYRRKSAPAAEKLSVVSLLGCQNKNAAASTTPWGASLDDPALTR